MKFTPRPYQKEAIDKGTYFFNHTKGKSALIVAPTAAGKSIYVAGIADKLSGKVLVLQPQKEILEQNYEKFTNMGGHAGIFSASAGRKDISRVTYATPGTVSGQLERFLDVKQVIIDECHLHSSMSSGRLKDIITALPNPKVLGLTATPFRMHSVMGGSMLKMLTRTRPKMFDELIHWTQIGDLLQQGYLAKLNYYRMCKGFDRRKIKVNSTGSDFEERSLKEYYKTIHFIHEIVDVVSRINKVGRQVLCFTSFVQDAHDVSEYLNRMGYASAVVSGKTKKKDREEIIRDFKSGRINSVINVGTLTTGFDYPELDCVVIARPMRSLSLYYQITGRVMRPHPNKEDGWVVDLCGNFEVFGRVEDLRVEFEKGKQNLPYIAGSGGKKLTGVLLHADENMLKKYKKQYNANWL